MLVPIFSGFLIGLWSRNGRSYAPFVITFLFAWFLAIGCFDVLDRRETNGTLGKLWTFIGDVSTEAVLFGHRREVCESLPEICDALRVGGEFLKPVALFGIGVGYGVIAPFLRHRANLTTNGTTSTVLDNAETKQFKYVLGLLETTKSGEAIELLLTTPLFAASEKLLASRGCRLERREEAGPGVTRHVFERRIGYNARATLTTGSDQVIIGPPGIQAAVNNNVIVGATLPLDDAETKQFEYLRSRVEKAKDDTFEVAVARRLCTASEVLLARHGFREQKHEELGPGVTRYVFARTSTPDIGISIPLGHNVFVGTQAAATEAGNLYIG